MTQYLERFLNELSRIVYHILVDEPVRPHSKPKRKQQILFKVPAHSFFSSEELLILLVFHIDIMASFFDHIRHAFLLPHPKNEQPSQEQVALTRTGPGLFG